MGKVFLDMVMSLDGFISGPNGEDKGLHNWYFSPSGAAKEIIDELLQTIGAMVLGKRTYDLAEKHGGFNDTPYKVPHFILSHEPGIDTTKGGVSLTFVTDGIENALAKAKAAAGEKDICISGGASVAQQYLKAGLIDELQIHLVPVFIGEGVRLFENLGSEGIKLEKTRVLESSGVTHLRYRVVKG